MNHHYSDIRDKLGEPQWWDESAVPRYCEFTPDATANIYASEAVLLLIECQGCCQPFKVAMTSGGHRINPWASTEGNIVLYPTLAELVASDEIHYGDPPNAGCCAAGPTMNSIPRRVLEFWENAAGSWEWTRRVDLEREIACDCVDDEASA